ncbi:unnamed protein product [Pieris macdunnoughi]|uniref:Uncharacterized protein n=1 Tax=Pieris macdunnoughi TaxID=345717 RepID=A0A821UJJ6_9NEOP|nr:unnamed protein product [Pieris macdunnoughi]
MPRSDRLTPTVLPAASQYPFRYLSFGRPGSPSSHLPKASLKRPIHHLPLVADECLLPRGPGNFGPRADVIKGGRSTGSGRSLFPIPATLESNMPPKARITTMRLSLTPSKSLLDHLAKGIRNKTGGSLCRVDFLSISFCLRKERSALRNLYNATNPGSRPLLYLGNPYQDYVILKILPG